MATSTPSGVKKGRLNRLRGVDHGAGPSTRFRHQIAPMYMMWLTFSLPLVIWDTGYIFLRPHSFPGGKYHSPVWRPYALYGSVDYVYGLPAWENHNGFTAAEGTLNIVETLMYFYYWAVVWRSSAKGWYTFRDVRTLFLGNEDKIVTGQGIAKAALMLFSAAVMTLSKTILYFLHEYYSGFAGVGHNTAWVLFWIYILPNVLWVIFPACIVYVLGTELVQGLDGSGYRDVEEKED